MSTLTSNDMHVTRPSTRVHAAPGGTSSICLGGYGDDAPAPRVSKTVAPVNKENTTSVQQPTQPVAAAQPAVVAAQQPVAAPEQTRAAANGEKTSVRVRQAPGGTSSFSLGW